MLALLLFCEEGPAGIKLATDFPFPLWKVTSLLGLTLRPLLHQHSLLYLVAFEAVAMEDLVGYSSSSEDEQENQ